MFDDPILLNCKSGADYLLNQVEPFAVQFNDLLRSYNLFIDRTNLDENVPKLTNFLSDFGRLIGETVVSGKIISLTAAGIEQSEQLSDFCKSAGQSSIKFLDKMRNRVDVKPETEELNGLMEKIVQTLKTLLPKSNDISKEELGDMIEQEMHNTSEAIEAAVSKLQALLSTSRSKDTGLKLEVNDKILDNCSNLMKAIKELIIKSKELQKEIVSQGRVKK
jgi:hypothetical protein